MSARLSTFDPMVGKWPSYESRLLQLPAIMAMTEAKRAHVLSQVRDAYLRCAPTLEGVPECPPAVHQYVLGVTLRLLAEVARHAGVFFDVQDLARTNLERAIALQEKEQEMAEFALSARARPIDVEAMLRECVPGGSIVDSQVVADTIRAWFALRQ